MAVPHIYAFANVPETPYMLRQGNCSDPYAGPPALNIRWTTVSAKCSNGALPDQLMNTSYKDFAPRVGIAVSPNSKTVVRAGFGMFYNQEIGNAYFDLARNIAGRVTLTSDAGALPAFSIAMRFPAAAAQPRMCPRLSPTPWSLNIRLPTRCNICSTSSAS